MTGRAYLLNQVCITEIHQEMSELLDKQVNAQKRKLPGFMQPTKKVCHENERKKQTRKNNTCVKLYSRKEALYNAHVKNR